MMSQLSVIINTYNSAEVIKYCLDNIDLTIFEVIIVDNASQDKTVEIVKSNFPQIEIIKNSQNLGFARANNIALRQVKKDFALLLNVDARISREDIKKTLEIMSQSPEIAIAGNIVHNCVVKNNQIISSHPCPKNQQQLKGNANDKFYINKFVTGAGMFLNMNIMRKIGFFDEAFFLYCEDNELCKRAIKKGYKTAIIKDTKIFHIGGSSSKISQSELEKIYWHKFGWSKLYYTKKIHGLIIAELRSLRMILKSLVIIIKEFLIYRKVSPKNSQAFRGCCAFLVGMKAFDENNNPRG